jgi:hypothetical protein
MPRAAFDWTISAVRLTACRQIERAADNFYAVHIGEVGRGAAADKHRVVNCHQISCCFVPDTVDPGPTNGLRV